MLVVDSEAMPLQPVTTDGATGCRMRELITARDGAPTFAMRQFELDPGGSTPWHSHPWEHEVFVLSGSGHVRGAEKNQPFAAGQAIFIGPNEQHAFVNTGSQLVRMLCLIPVDQVCCR